MHSLRWNERCGGTSSHFNAAADTGSERSNTATWNRTDPWHYNAGAESERASGNTTNKSDYTAGKYRHAASNAVGNTTGRYGAGRIY